MLVIFGCLKDALMTEHAVYACLIYANTDLFFFLHTELDSYQSMENGLLWHLSHCPAHLN